MSLDQERVLMNLQEENGNLRGQVSHLEKAALATDDELKESLQEIDRLREKIAQSGSDKLTKSVIELFASEEYLRSNIIAETKTSRSLHAKTEWIKDFIEGGFLEDATWISDQLSAIVIELCDWQAVFAHFSKGDQ